MENSTLRLVHCPLPSSTLPLTGRGLAMESRQPNVTSRPRWGTLSKVLTVTWRCLQPSARRAVEASSTSCPGATVLISSTETPFFYLQQAALPLPCPTLAWGLQPKQVPRPWDPARPLSRAPPLGDHGLSHPARAGPQLLCPSHIHIRPFLTWLASTHTHTGPPCSLALLYAVHLLDANEVGMTQQTGSALCPASHLQQLWSVN